MSAETITLAVDSRPWSLAALADPDVFDRHHDAVARAIADRFTLKAHFNVTARQRAFDRWIAYLCGRNGSAADHRDFIAACAALIAALGSEPTVSYSPMMTEGKDRMLETVLAYPGEVTALAAGAAVYLLGVRDLTGADPSVPVSALVIGNAAASLRRDPRSAERFRELMQLSTPWN